VLLVLTSQRQRHPPLIGQATELGITAASDSITFWLRRAIPSRPGSQSLLYSAKIYAAIGSSL